MYMRYLGGLEEVEALKYIMLAGEVAKDATCTRSKCGSVIVNLDLILGTGFNSPVGNLENQRRCDNPKTIYDKKVTDKTCCVHAEQRAIMDALSSNSKNLDGSRLYFVRLKNEQISKSGEPYCTICSKMALDVGIDEFVLYKKDGICVYDTQEYNNLSYKYESL